MSFIRTSRHILHPDSGMTHGVASEITPCAVYEDRRRWLVEFYEQAPPGLRRETRGTGNAPIANADFAAQRQKNVRS